MNLVVLTGPRAWSAEPRKSNVTRSSSTTSRQRISTGSSPTPSSSRASAPSYTPSGRSAVADLPDGVYEGADALDDDGVGEEPVEIRCRLVVDDERVTFDFRGSADQARGPVNTTRFITAASAHYVVKAVLAPAAVPNAGMRDAVEVLTRRGSVCDAAPGAPLVAGNHETSQRIVDAALAALAQVA